QVAMHDVVAVQGQHPRDQLRQGRAQACLIEAAAGADILQERHALNQVHRKEPLAAIGLQGVQADELGEVDVGQGAGLALEAGEARTGRGRVWGATWLPRWTWTAW